jgi:chromosome segregation ATPase
MNDTSDNTAVVPNRSSIDLSLELERQLEAEIPNSPASFQAEHSASLDPNVLAHIVTQLRDSLTNVNKEREDLIQQLTESHSRMAEFKDAISLLTDGCARLELELAAARQKNQEDDEAISMLRSKGVEYCVLRIVFILTCYPS